jgi:ABC-type dipeptide/oligopeptide/nickel transport system permease component
VFLLGYLALVLFAVPPEGAGQAAAAVAILALGDGMLSDVVLGLDAELARLRGRDFVQSARLRGTALWHHYVPHLALPVAQIAASRMAWLIGGVLVLEMVLGIQGIGLIGYKAADAADFPLLVAITVFVTAIVAGSALLVDVLRVLVDPRVRKDRRAVGRA